MAITRLNPIYGSESKTNTAYDLTCFMYQGRTGTNTYADIPVPNLGAESCRRTLWVFCLPNTNAEGALFYIGITNSGTVGRISTIFKSDPSTVPTLTATANIASKTVRIDFGRNWSTFLVLSNVTFR